MSRKTTLTDFVARLGMKEWNILVDEDRLALAWRLATDRLTDFDYGAISEIARDVTGFYPLEGITLSCLVEDAKERWEDHPELERLCREAIYHVWRRWSSTGDVSGAATEWALDKVEEYARGDGIELIKLGDES